MTFNAGNYRQQDTYKSFLPEPVNKKFTWEDGRITKLLSEADQALGELNAYSRLIPDVDYFIHMHVVKEAITSSHIEGTKTTFDEALMKEEDVIPERRDDRQEVLNYIEALHTGIHGLEKIPLSMRLLKKVHKILLQGVRGKHKAPGEVRRTQNWIGGSSLQDAFFIPPHHLDIPDLLTDLESFWHNKNLDMPPLIKAALSHYQFETIHPFLDGNGRLGRLLITLILIAEGRLDKPVLYLSDFFDRNRGSYYDSLTMARSSNDIEQWLRFFLKGVSETATLGKQVLSNVVDLRIVYTDRIRNSVSPRRQTKATELLTVLYKNPYTTSKDVASVLKITHPTANVLIEEMVHTGLLKEVTGHKRNRIYHLWEYQELFAPLSVKIDA